MTERVIEMVCPLPYCLSAASMSHVEMYEPDGYDAGWQGDVMCIQGHRFTMIGHAQP